MLRLLAAAAVLAAVTGTAHADPLVLEPGRDVVQPGMLVTLDGQPQCTGGFLYDGIGRLSGHVYLGLAAHCVEHAIGRVVGDERGRRIGTVAFSHWPYTGFADDFSFVDIDPAVWKRTSPALAGHPDLPKSLGNFETVQLGDRVQFSGWGMASEMNGTTREGRVGVLNGYDDKLWGAETLVSPGDSGGPLVDLESGAAVGSVSNVCAPLPVNTSDGFEPGCTGYGPTIERIVLRARELGFPVKLRTAAMGPPRR